MGRLKLCYFEGNYCILTQDSNSKNSTKGY